MKKKNRTIKNENWEEKLTSWEAEDCECTHFSITDDDVPVFDRKEMIAFIKQVEKDAYNRGVEDAIDQFSTNMDKIFAYADYLDGKAKISDMSTVSFRKTKKVHN